MEEYYITELYLKDIEEIKSENQATNYVRNINNLISNYQNNFESTILAGIIYDHQSKCQYSKCFCWR